MKIVNTTLLVLITFFISFAKQNIAILELTGSGIDSSNLRALTEKLSYELLATDSFSVLERSEMAMILKEQEFQQTGCTDATCAVEVGQLLNVDEMVVGSVNKLGSLYTIMLRSLNVGTGEVVRSASVDCYDYQVEDLMISAMKHVSLLFAGVDKERVNKIAPLKSVKETQPAKSADGYLKVAYKGEGKGYGTVIFKIDHKGPALTFMGAIYNYGDRGVKITGVPQGKQSYSFKGEWSNGSKGSVKVEDDEISTVILSSDKSKRVKFTIDAGFVNIFAPSLAANEDHLVIIKTNGNSNFYEINTGEESIATFAPSLALGWESKRMRFEVGFILDVKNMGWEEKNYATYGGQDSVMLNVLEGWIDIWYSMGWLIPIHESGNFVFGAEPGLRLSFRTYERTLGVDPTLNGEIISSNEFDIGHYGGTLGYTYLYMGSHKIQFRGGYSIGGGIEKHIANYDNNPNTFNFKLSHSLSASIHFIL